MAKRRLNKKLLTVLLLMGIPMLLVFWYAASTRWPRVMPGFLHAVLGHDPEKLLEQGRELKAEAERMEAANQEQANSESDPEKRYNLLQELNKETSEKKWGDALEALGSAYKYSRGRKELRGEIITTMADVHQIREDYGKAIGAWKTLTERDATNYDAKRKIADFYYDVARHGGGVNLWTDVDKNADSLIELKPDDAYGYVMKAHADLALLMSEATEDPAAMRSRVDETLGKTLGLDDKNIQAYRMLADLAMYDRGRSEEESQKEQFAKEAEKYLRTAVEKNPAEIEAYLNLFTVYLERRFSEKNSRAGAATVKSESERLVSESEKYFSEVASELDEWIKQFPEEARLYIFKARLFQMRMKKIEEVERLVELYKKAMECDDTQSGWYVSLAQLYVLRARYSDDSEANLSVAFKLLRKALYLPDAMDLKGPKRAVTVNTRFGRIIPLMIDVCVSLFETVDQDERKKEYTVTAEKLLKELRESVGDDNVFVKVAAGSLALAEGRKSEGIRILYEADQQLKLSRGSGGITAQLKWKLFQALRDTEYRNLASRYAVQAMRSGPRPVKDYVEYMEHAVKLAGNQNQKELLSFIQSYENRYASEDAYHQRVLLVKAMNLLELGQVEEAGKVASKLSGESKEVRIVRAKSQVDPEKRAQELSKLVGGQPGDAELVNVLFLYYMSQGVQDASYYDRARDLVAAAVKAAPDNLVFKQMERILSEPAPGDVSAIRTREIEFEIVKAIEDPHRRAKELGAFYFYHASRGRGEDQKEQVEQDWRASIENFNEAIKIKNDDFQSMGSGLRAALTLGDWSRAEELSTMMIGIDATKGLLYQASLQSARKEWDKAALSLESFLEKEPISIDGHLALAQVYSQLKRFEEAMRELRTAISQDVYNVRANRMLAASLHNINVINGMNQVGPEQIKAVLAPVTRILNVIPNDLSMSRLDVTYKLLWMSHLGGRLKDGGLTAELRGEYQKTVDSMHQDVVRKCEYIISLEPKNPISRRMLANAYFQYSQFSKSDEERKRLQSKTEEVYKEAIKQIPDSVDLVDAYGSFLRRIGREGRDEELLKDFIAGNTGKLKSDATIRLSNLYQRQGQQAKAAELLAEVLKTIPEHHGAAITLAELYSRMEQYDDAISLFRQLRAKQDSEYLMTRQTELLLHVGKEEEAVKLLEEMQQKYPEYAGAKLLAGKVAMYKTNYAEAVAYAEQVLAMDSGNVQAHLIKGRALYYEGEFNKALETVKQLRAIVPSEDNTGRTLLALVNWRLGFHNEAINELRTAANNDAENQAVRRLLIKMLKERSRWEDLERFYADMIKVHPKSVSLYVEAGRAAMQLGDQYMQKRQSERAKRQYAKSLRLMQDGWKVSQSTNEGKEMALDGLLTVMLKVGMYSEALDLAGTIVDSGSADTAMLLHKAEATYRLGRQKEALDIFESIVKKVEGQPDLSAEVLSNISRVGQADTVLAWAAKKLEQKPNWTAMRLVIAGIYHNKGEMEKEIAELTTARDLANEKQIQRIDKQLLATYVQNSRWEDVTVICRRLLEQRPNDAGLLNNLAYSLMEMGEKDKEAVDLAKKAYDLKRTDSNIMDTYAIALLRTGQFAQAELILLRAIQESQRSSDRVPAEYEYHLAQALNGQERYQEAKELLLRTQKGLSQSSDSQDAKWLERINELLGEIDGKTANVK